MSDHTWDYETKSNKRKVVYSAGGSWPDHEISQEEALQLGSYLARHYNGDVLDRVEIVEKGSPTSVTYHAHTWPDPELVRSHLKSYGPVPFRVFTPIEERDTGRTRNLYEMDGTGTLRGRAEHVLDSRGELLSETRMKADGKSIGRLEYVYNEDGDLTLTREFGPNGELYNEIPSEPD